MSLLEKIFGNRYKKQTAELKRKLILAHKLIELVKESENMSDRLVNAYRKAEIIYEREIETLETKLKTLETKLEELDDKYLKVLTRLHIERKKRS